MTKQGSLPYNDQATDVEHGDDLKSGQAHGLYESNRDKYMSDNTHYKTDDNSAMDYAAP